MLQKKVKAGTNLV